MDKNGVAEMLKKLVAADGLSGDETAVGALVRSLARDYVSDVRTDALGNVIAHRRGASQSPGSVMLAAHMDEIGLVVTKVDRGFLHVDRVGGVDPRLLLGQEVTVYPSGPGAAAHANGLPGYIGLRPPHLLSGDERNKVTPLHDLRVDLGQPPSFFEKGIVSVGDHVVLRGPYTELLGGRVAAKSMDDRSSVAAMLGALGYLADMQHSFDVYAVATAQEETGLYGARTSAFGVAPDLAVAIDVTFGETPGVDGDATVDMDKGPAISWGPNLHPGIVKRLRQVADALEIPYVSDPVPGASGTDAWAIQVAREGIPTGLLGIPLRYMHSVVETVVLADIDRTARLLAAFISRLDGGFLTTLAEEV
jgi:putative aminopeptidase FrvX